MKNKEELKKKTGVILSCDRKIKCISSIDGIKRFSFCIQNPPYADRSNGGMYLDMQFVEKVNEISNMQIAIHPANRWISNTKIGKNNAESGHLKEIDIIDGNKYFDIGTLWRWAGIYYYDNNNNYDNTIINFEDNDNVQSYTSELNREDRIKIWETLMFPNDLYNVVKEKFDIRKQLLNKYQTMVNDGHGFIYEENRLQRGKTKYNITKKDQYQLERVRKYLKEGTYKYCLYKGSGNHIYDEVQRWNGEDPDKLFKGQMCWLTNKENVKNNLIYWMECPLFDLWRKYFMNGWKMATMCAYGHFPAIDFEMNENDFKEYVDSLNDFTEEEIKILKENNIHNADKLKTKK